MVQVPQPKAVRTRDKKAKIVRIMDATLRLIEKNGYDQVTSREIAKEADVSNGLVFKYFPRGKPAIVRAIGLRLSRDVLGLLMPGAVDFEDFPGSIRVIISRIIAYERNNDRILTAISIASLTDKTVFEGIEEAIDYDETALPAYFSRFKGMNITRIERQPDLVTQWLEIVNAVILHHLLYPSAFATDEKLIDALVKISLKLWDYEDES